MATIQENFNEWKEWTYIHGFTPRRHSLDKKEDNLSAKVGCIIRKLKKEDPNNYILEEYEAICKEYRIGYIPRKKRRSPFEIWKEWCETHNRLPRTTSDDKEEVRIAFAITKYIDNMYEKGENEQIIEEYYIIRTYYRLKDKARRKLKSLEVLKNWCEEQGRLPNYKSSDVEEKEIAMRIRNAYYSARKKPNFYSEFLTEYDKIVSKYK
ncbi:MAG: hypothetical protein IKV94_03005 [Clostridia bacterium]|nr:hypothetical protein [Clostridia bacterium]